MSDKKKSPSAMFRKIVVDLFRDNREFIEANPHIIPHIEKPEQWHIDIQIMSILEQ